MAKRMLIDATHPEETRVVVTGGNRLEEFDYESSTKKQVKGNIYLAKVTRVEPSLQAAFVDYGGNRHGFLAFSEIHPDYYRIPVSDRRFGEAEGDSNGHVASDDHDDDAVPIAAALPELVPVRQASEAEADDDSSAEDGEADAPEQQASDASSDVIWPPLVEPEAELHPDSEPATAQAVAAPRDETAAAVDAASPPPAEAVDEIAVAAPAGDEAEPHVADAEPTVAATPSDTAEVPMAAPDHAAEWDAPSATIALRSAEEASLTVDAAAFAHSDDDIGHAGATEIGDDDAAEPERPEAQDSEGHISEPQNSEAEWADAAEWAEAGRADAESVETMGGDEVEEVEEADAERHRYQPSSRHYKIQEVIKRRQIMLVQVAKEERGNKGAALTTYLSLAGRYCVLMPNTNRGGGVSRKITSIADRRRLKEIVEELEIPEGMGVIVRTAGAERSKAEIKRDYEYLLRLWNEIREMTLQSTAPALIYEEGNLIKRSIRDLYTRDIDEVLVEGEEGYKTAKAFMRTLMPSHAKRVQPFRDPQIGLFHRFQIESQIDAIHSPIAQLRSGGYVVINQTEALVAIDVNSGRSTRERNIEETALRTNLEAAEELARQLRLRDLAGLIVIDFIDMEEHRNQVAVERRLKEALRNDRARIQVGRISPFGLMEMSRQRLRPSLAEASTQPCPHCGGTGFIRSVESTALYVLRSIEEEGIRRRSADICIYVPTNVALYILNQKRESLAQIELRYALRVTVARDDALIPPNFRLERLRQYGLGEAPPLPAIQAPVVPEEADEDEEEVVEIAEAAPETADEQESEEERGRRRRRRRRRRPDEAREAREPRDGSAAEASSETNSETVAAVHEADSSGPAEHAERAPPEDDAAGRDGDSDRRHRRRGRRGGRIRTPRRDEAAEAESTEAAEAGSTWAVEAEATEVPVVAETIEFAAMLTEDGDNAAVADLTPWVEATPWVEVEPSVEATPSVEVEPSVEVAPWVEVAPSVEVGPSVEVAPWVAAAPVETFAVTPLDADPAEPSPAHEEAAPTSVESEPLPTAEAEQGIPFISEPERAFEEVAVTLHETALETAPEVVEVVAAEHNGAAPGGYEKTPAAPAPRPNEDILTVTEKPTNPRRGWWQRLMQS